MNELDFTTSSIIYINTKIVTINTFRMLNISIDISC